MHADSHGHSTAAWAGVGVMLVGAVIACWGVLMGPFWLLYLGLGLGVAGALVWYGMELAGYGSRQHQDSTDDTGASSSPGSVRLSETRESQDLTDSPEAGQAPQAEHQQRPRR